MIKLNKIYPGNCLTVLKTFPDKFFYTCVTSPPYYGLRSYGTEPQIWDGKEDCKHKWSKEIIASNSGGGWFDPEKRDQYENQRLRNPKKEKQNKVSQGCFCSKCNAWKGELGLEPTYQLYLSHLIDIFREVKRVLKDDGTLFVNLGDSYGINKIKTMLQIPARFSILMTDELGFLLRNRIIWEKNVMPTSAKDRFTNNYEDIFFFSKQAQYYFEQQLEPANYDGRKDTKFKGSNKYSSPDFTPDGNVNTFAKEGHERWTEVNGIKMRNKRAIWKFASEGLKEEHFATYPQKLIEPIIKAGCPEFICSKCEKPRNINYIKTFVPQEDVSLYKNKKEGNKGLDKSSGWGGFPMGTNKFKFDGYTDCNCDAGFVPGIVLDPFIGSGTTGIVARKLNRNFIGIDLKYHDISDNRLTNELGFFK